MTRINPNARISQNINNDMPLKGKASMAVGFVSTVGTAALTWQIPPIEFMKHGGNLPAALGVYFVAPVYVGAVSGVVTYLVLDRIEKMAKSAFSAISHLFNK